MAHQGNCSRSVGWIALSASYGRLLDGLDGAACLLLLGMTLLIGADVVSRNAGLGGIPWSGEVSEDILYLLTLLAAPWLLRQGQHIRVDILLRALPARLGWLLEWVGDLLGLACSLYFVWYGWKVLAASYTRPAPSPSRRWSRLNGGCWRRCPSRSCCSPSSSCSACTAWRVRARTAHGRGVGVMTPARAEAARAVRHDVAIGGAAAAGRIDGAVADRHAGGAVVRGHQHCRRLAVPRRRGRASRRSCATAWCR